MVIDSHTHVLDEKSYREYAQKAKGRVDKIMAFAFFYQDMEKLWQFTSTKDDLFLVGSIDVKKDIDSQLKLARKMFEEKKIWGLKLYPGYQYFYPQDKEVFPIAELCQKYGKPLILHSGDFYDVRGWTHKAMLKYSRPVHVDELADHYPDCKIIIPHFGFPYMLEAALLSSKHKNVFLDLSGIIDVANNTKEFKMMIKRYADDLKRACDYYPDIRKKIMFGTDFIGNDTPLNEVRSYLDLASNVFPKREKSLVLGELAQNIFFS